MEPTIPESTTSDLCCGVMDNNNVDESGETLHSSVFDISSSASTITPNPADCSCSNNLILNSFCQAQDIQSATIGEYERVCMISDETTVYMHVDPVINMYIYHMDDTKVMFIKGP